MAKPTALTLGGLRPPKTPPWGDCVPPEPPAIYEGASPPQSFPLIYEFFKTASNEAPTFKGVEFERWARGLRGVGLSPTAPTHKI